MQTFVVPGTVRSSAKARQPLAQRFIWSSAKLGRRWARGKERMGWAWAGDVVNP